MKMSELKAGQRVRASWPGGGPVDGTVCFVSPRYSCVQLANGQKMRLKSTMRIELLSETEGELAYAVHRHDAARAAGGE